MSKTPGGKSHRKKGMILYREAKGTEGAYAVLGGEKTFQIASRLVPRRDPRAARVAIKEACLPPGTI